MTGTTTATAPAAGARAGRRRARWVALAALVVGGLVAGGVGLVGPSTSATAAPLFQMPFPCGQQWSGQTRTDHSPADAVDLNRGNDYGDPVVAAAGGTVTRVANEGSTSYGRWVEVDHGAGWRTRYAHLSVQRVSVGQHVRQGQLLGNVGSTGGSTGPHLHFEQTYYGSPQRIAFNGSRILYWGTRSYTSRNSCGGTTSQTTNPFSPKDVCGSAYDVIDSARLGTSGRVYLTYDASTGRNCVVTLKVSGVGQRSSGSAFLEVKGQRRVTEAGSFRYYAGPVRRAAASTCVRWGGSLGSSTYSSTFEHCG